MRMSGIYTNLFILIDCLLQGSLRPKPTRLVELFVKHLMSCCGPAFLAVGTFYF